jgi:hypothetical protein
MRRLQRAVGLQEIRNGKITREEGVALVKKFDGEFPCKSGGNVDRVQCACTTNSIQHAR